MSEKYWVLVDLHELSPPEAMGPFTLEEAQSFIEKEGHFTVGTTLVKEVGEVEDEQE